MEDKRKDDQGLMGILSGLQSILRILVYVLLIVLLILVAKKAYDIGSEVGNTAPVSKENGQDVLVIIDDSMTVRDIGELLRKNGLINEEPFSFMIQEALSDYHNKILPGSYTLNSGMSIDEILAAISPSGEEENEENQP